MSAFWQIFKKNFAPVARCSTKVFSVFDRLLWQGFNRFFTCPAYSGVVCRGGHCHIMATKTQQKQDSVQDIMQKMAGRMDTLLDAHERTQKARETGVIPDELHFWLAVDPLLADLHKQFLDARANHIRLSRLRGAKDPMTDVANDMVDSTQCAFETRLLELRKDEESKRTVLALMRRAHELHQRELNEQALAETADYWRRQAIPKKRRAVQEGIDSFWMVMLGLMVLRQSLMDANEKLSIADLFSRASRDDKNAEFSRQLFAAG